MTTESLTYRELAQRLGVKLESARKAVMRKRWQKVTGNDGLVRIIVPLDALPRPVDSPEDSPEVSPKVSPEDDPAVYARELETRIEGLRELLAAETRRAETAEADRDHWRSQADLVGQLLVVQRLRRSWFGFLKAG